MLIRSDESMKKWKISEIISLNTRPNGFQEKMKTKKVLLLAGLMLEAPPINRPQLTSSSLSPASFTLYFFVSDFLLRHGRSCERSATNHFAFCAEPTRFGGGNQKSLIRNMDFWSHSFDLAKKFSKNVRPNRF